MHSLGNRPQSWRQRSAHPGGWEWRAATGSADDLLPPDKVARQLAVVDGVGGGAVAFGPWAQCYHDGHIEAPNARRYWHDYPDRISLLVDMWYDGGFFPSRAWHPPRALIDRTGGWNEALTGDDDGEFYGRRLIAADALRFWEETRTPTAIRPRDP